jgi:hypothetical protein
MRSASTLHLFFGNRIRQFDASQQDGFAFASHPSAAQVEAGATQRQLLPQNNPEVTITPE